MTIVSESKHVQVFKINKKNKQNETLEFQSVLQGGTSAGSTSCAVTSWNRHAIRLALLDIAERRRCRKMFAVQSHERLRREVDEVVVRTSGYAEK